jgi:hypothetical protein
VKNTYTTQRDVTVGRVRGSPLEALDLGLIEPREELIVRSNKFARESAAHGLFGIGP